MHKLKAGIVAAEHTSVADVASITLTNLPALQRKDTSMTQGEKEGEGTRRYA